MIKSTNLFKIGFGTLLLFSSIPVLSAEDPIVEKRKTYSKSYDLSSSDKISLQNSFGEMKINVWNKKEVKVDVVIITKSSTEERAQELLDAITIEDGKKSNEVYFKTVRNEKKKSEKNENNGKNEKTETNYSVYLPAGNSLQVSNKFGPTFIPDISGPLVMDISFGALTAGHLADVKKLDVEFGTASIESMKGNNIDIKFSRAIINKVDGDLKANFQHCSGIKLGIENDTKAVTINNNFSTIYLDVDKGLSADFLIANHFGSFTNNTAFNIQELNNTNAKKGPRFDKNYSGKSGAGTVPIKVNSDFGNVVVGHNLTMNLKEDKKTTKI